MIPKLRGATCGVGSNVQALDTDIQVLHNTSKSIECPLVVKISNIVLVFNGKMYCLLKRMNSFGLRDRALIRSN